jgi:hypothetical protein
MRPLHRSEAHQVDIDSELSQLHRRCQPGEPAADQHYPGFRHDSPEDNRILVAGLLLEANPAH